MNKRHMGWLPIAFAAVTVAACDRGGAKVDAGTRIEQVGQLM